MLRVLFLCFYGPRLDFQYPAILTELIAWSIKDLLYGIKSTKKNNLHTCLLQNIYILNSSTFFFFVFILVDDFEFSCFLVPLGQGNHKKSFYFGRKYLFRWKKTFVHLLELWRNFICRNETGSPRRAVSLHLARLGSQSEHRIHRWIPALWETEQKLKTGDLLLHNCHEVSFSHSSREVNQIK